MGDKSKIEWTEATWNPIVGCSIVSPGCTNCYAMKMAGRLEAMARAAFADDRPAVSAHYLGTTQDSKAGPVWTGKVNLAPERILLQPLSWKRQRRIFVNSMSDLFHESVPDEWIDRVFAVMALASQHTFQVLTKRAERMRDFVGRLGYAHCGLMRRLEATDGVHYPSEKIDAFPHYAGALGHPSSHLQWPLPNVWLGVSAEDQKRADERIPHLLMTPAAVRFVSAEPLLGPIDFHGEWIDRVAGNDPELNWIIVGGESGHNARPVHPDWARSIRDQCQAAGVPFFFKQWGEHAPNGSGRYSMVKVGKRAAGRLLDGREHNEMPGRAS